jgi:hypothetical protein
LRDLKEFLKRPPNNSRRGFRFGEKKKVVKNTIQTN